MQTVDQKSAPNATRRHTHLTTSADSAPSPPLPEHPSIPGRQWLSQRAPLWFARRWLEHPERLIVRKYTLPITGLPARLDGLRIAHISDLHLGRCVSSDFVRAVVNRALALRPDVIALTGDYVENTRSPVHLLTELLGPLADRSRSGAALVVGVLGNHDWYAGAERVGEALNHAGITVLDNTHTYVGRDGELVDSSHAPDALCLAGFGDLEHRDTRAQAALGAVDPDTARLVLAHHPDTAEELTSAMDLDLRIDLMLCGHTHGGQIRLPFIGAPIVPSRFGQKYLGGLVQGPAFRVLVSRGAGMTTLPLRIGVPPEIGEITLIRAPD